MVRSAAVLLLLGWLSTALAQRDPLLRGIVLDEATGEPIEFANIALYTLPDSALLDGTTTDEQGAFSLPANDGGREAYFTVQFMGYRTFTSGAFGTGGPLDVGVIRLAISAEVLEAVEVTGRQMTNLHRLDRQVYVADQFQNARGGTAVDLVRNLPSVSVNALGEITVRGSTGFTIMLNGKPLQTDPATVLGQLPANAIRDIEIITAPSARYDPDGKAGIINVNTLQRFQDGLFLQANLLGGLPSVEPYDNAEAQQRYGADLSLNWRRGPWDLALGAEYRRDDIGGRREGYVNTLLDGVLTEFPSDGERSFDNTQYSGRLGVTFTPNPAHALSAAFYAGKRTKDRTADILYDYQQRTRIAPTSGLMPIDYWARYRETGTVYPGGERLDSLTYFNENLRVRRGDFVIASLDYEHTFPDNATLRLSGLYEHTLLGGPTDNINLAWPDLRDTLQLQYNTNDNPLDGVRLQADYSRPLGDLALDVGYLFRNLHHPGDFLYLDRDLDEREWVPNPEFTNGIDLRRQIHALYGQLSGSHGRWSYRAGVRGEYFDRRVRIQEPDTTYTLSPFNFFPSANLQYNAGQGLQLKVAYSRRIERTTTFKMTPFPEREHSETLEQGDAELLPEYIDLAEAGLVKTWGSNTAFATAYYRHTENVINRVNTVYNDTILNRIYTNVGNARAIGLELGATLYPARPLRLYVGGNLFNYRIRGDLFEDEINTSNLIYSLNASLNADVLPTLELQLAFNYLSRRITAQGEDSRFYNPSLTLRKTFLDEALAITFQWLNMDAGLLRSNEQRITTWRDDFYTTTNYVYEVDILTLGLSYRLNQAPRKQPTIRSEFGEKEF